MKSIVVSFVFVLFALSVSANVSFAQDKSLFEVISNNDELEKIVPASFYFAGLSGDTQRRNSSVGKLGEKRLIVAALVDTSGYSTEISGIYEGFFITDSPVKFGSKKLGIGAYGFGFASNGSVNLFDLSARKILTVESVKDDEMSRPRPLMMAEDAKGIRLYKGRNYVLVRPR